VVAPSEGWPPFALVEGIPVGLVGLEPPASSSVEMSEAGVALLLRQLGGLEGDLAMNPLQLEKLPVVTTDWHC
jgi:hypothetical protein